MLSKLHSFSAATAHRLQRINLTFLLFALVVVIACLFPLYRPGWPVNHEFLAFAYRTNIYLAHILRGDLFPIWSSSDAFGYGTPEAFFYHKAFYYVASLLFGIFSSMHVALVIAIGLFLMVGAYGFRRLLRSVSIDQPIILSVFPLLFISSNYVFTNWLIRGAMAEFSAMMVLPWLIAWCTDLIVKKRISYSIILIFILLYFSHNIIALFSLPLVGLAFVIFIIISVRGMKKAQLSDFVKAQAIRCCIIAGGLLGLMMPYVYLYLKYSRDYSPSGITSQGYLATQNFMPKSVYLVDGPFRWLRDGVSMNLNVGYVINLMVLAATGLYLYLLVSRKKIKRAPVVLFLFTSLLLYWAIMLPRAAWLYNKVGVMQFIQFPWRNLTFITTLSLVIGALALSVVTDISKWVGRVIVLGVILGAIIFSPLMFITKNHDQYLPKERVEERFVNTKKLMVPPSIIGIGQYLPLRLLGGKKVPVGSTLGWYISLSNNPNQLHRINNHCALEDKPTMFESNQRLFLVSCSQPSEIILPINYSSFISVSEFSNSKTSSLRAYRTSDDPRVHVFVPAAKGVITVNLPSLLN